MIILHIWGIQTFVVPTFNELLANFGYSLLSCIANEYFWAKTATLLGPIHATIGSTAFMIPCAFLMDFVIWPSSDTNLPQKYIVGIVFVLLSFIVVSFAKDPDDTEIILDLE